MPLRIAIDRDQRFGQALGVVVESWRCLIERGQRIESGAGQIGILPHVQAERVEHHDIADRTPPRGSDGRQLALGIDHHDRPAFDFQERGDQKPGALARAIWPNDQQVWRTVSVEHHPTAIAALLHVPFVAERDAGRAAAAAPAKHAARA